MANRASRDPHPWRGALILGAFVIVGGMAFSFLHPVVLNKSGWTISPDVWLTADAAQYIANGALGYVYESNVFYRTLPLWPIVLAPAAALGQYLELSSYPVAHPSMWLVLGPIGLATSIPMLYTVRALGRRLTLPGQDFWTQAAFVPVVVAPAALFGHYEDVLTVALVLLALIAVLGKRFTFAAFLLSVGICFKQWAVLGLPALIKAAPKGTRWRSALSGVLLPGLLTSFLLIVDWTHAVPALLRGWSFSNVGHPLPWVETGTVVVSGPYQLFSVAGATLVALVVRDLVRIESLVAALGLAYSTRLLFEPVIHWYYLAPALALFLFLERLETGRHRRTLILGVPLIVMFWWFPNPYLWRGLFLAGMALLVVPSLRQLRREPIGVPQPDTG